MIKISVDTHSSAKGNPQMKKKKDILSLLEEVQTVAQTLYSEKATLGDHVKTIAAEMSTLRAEKAQLAQALQAPPPQAEPTKIEAKLSKLRAEKTQEIWNLQEINAHLTQELQETKTQLAQGLQAPPPQTEPTQEKQALQASNAQLTKELQETKTQLTQALQAPQPQAELTQEVQTLQAGNAQLTKKLQETKTQLAQALQAPPPQAEPTEIEAKLSKLRAEKTQEIWNLQEINAHLTQELQETKTQLAHGVPSDKENIDSLPPEFQNLKEQLQYAEFHNFLLEQEVSTQHDEIQVLERSLETATSQASPSSPVDESLATSSS